MAGICAKHSGVGVIVIREFKNMLLRERMCNLRNKQLNNDRQQGIGSQEQQLFSFISVPFPMFYGN